MSQKVDVFLRPSVSWLVHLTLSLGTPFCLYRSVSQFIGPLSSVCRRTFLSLSVSQSVGLSAHLFLTAHLSDSVGQLVSWFIRSLLYHGTPFCLCRSVSQLVGPFTFISRHTFLSLSVSQSVGLSANLYIKAHLSVFVGQSVSWLVSSPLYYGAPTCLCRSVTQFAGPLTSVSRCTYLSLSVS